MNSVAARLVSRFEEDNDVRVFLRKIDGVDCIVVKSNATGTEARRAVGRSRVSIETLEDVLNVVGSSVLEYDTKNKSIDMRRFRVK